jgi:hypothetical protein
MNDGIRLEAKNGLCQARDVTNIDLFKTHIREVREKRIVQPSHQHAN